MVTIICKYCHYHYQFRPLVQEECPRCGVEPNGEDISSESFTGGW